MRSNSILKSKGFQNNSKIITPNGTPKPLVKQPGSLFPLHANELCVESSVLPHHQVGTAMQFVFGHMKHESNSKCFIFIIQIISTEELTV